MSKQYRRLCACDTSIPSFAYPGETIATHCALCKTDTMVGLYKKCICGLKQPCFDYPGIKTAKYCVSCKLENMVNVKDILCQCNKSQPSYNFPSETKAICCKECKQPEMININEKRKCVCGQSRPLFNFSGEEKPKYCASCRLPDMVNIVNRRCFCKKSVPTFNLSGETIAKYCASCKLPEMINVRDKKCLCNSALPSYNLPHEKTPICCIKCKTPDMINPKEQKRKCHCGKSRASFNYPNESKPTHCASCKESNMVDIIHKRCECGKFIPSFNYEYETTAICCSECKKEDMVNVIDKRCPGISGSICPYDRFGNIKYRNYCAECFRREFPLDPITFQIRSKTKEIAVRDFINSVFEGFVHDQTLETTHCDCTIRRRIDHRKLIGNTLLAIETDENQHNTYDKMDEDTRYDDLYMAHSGKWIYIRFNPDKYIDKKGTSKNPTIATRLETLQREIEKQIIRIETEQNTELIERIYLYFDGYDVSTAFQTSLRNFTDLRSYKFSSN